MEDGDLAPRHLGIPVETEGRFECGKGEPIGAESASEGIGAAPGDDLPLAHQTSCLWPTEEFVARKDHEIGAGGDRGLHSWLAAQAPWAQIEQQAAADVMQVR